MDIRKEIEEKRERILAVAAEHGARNVRIFGSVSRGEADEKSDIDFLVELDQDRSLMDHAGLQIALQELFDRKIDVVSDRGLKPRIKDRVLREAVPL